MKGFNRSHGADHIFVCCHDMGLTALNLAAQDSLDVRNNVVWLGYSADIRQRIQGIPQLYVHGRDVSLPLYAADDDPGNKLIPDHLNISVPRRGPLAFFAGKMDSDGRTRESIATLNWTVPPNASRKWTPQSEKWKGTAVNSMLVVAGKLPQHKYKQWLRTAKFCLVPRGSRVWSPRIGEAFLSGCVPVVLANGYALPLRGVHGIVWSDFSVVHDDSLPALAHLPARLDAIAQDAAAYDKLRLNLLKVRKHFLWHSPEQRRHRSYADDAVGMVLYQLWLRKRNLPALFRRRRL